MSILKRIPIKYLGELHDIKLINFSVERDELKGMVPPEIKVRDFNGRAIISMVNVNLKMMRPSFMPKAMHFNYRHIAFRLLVEDSAYNKGENKGIYFLESFTNKPLIVWGGSLLTEYKLEMAEILDAGHSFNMNRNGHFIRYHLEDKKMNGEYANLKNIVGALDRAYSVLGDKVRVTQIQREKWPIEPIECSAFETNFFKTAKLEGAFKVNETIYYQWLPPKTVTP
jgi:uncharacterized protein YqjF (DUF2071 family)